MLYPVPTVLPMRVYFFGNLVCGVAIILYAICRRAHPASRDEYDYSVILHSDGSTRSMELPLESYSNRKNTNIGAGVLLYRGREGGDTDEEVQACTNNQPLIVFAARSCRRDVGMAAVLLLVGCSFEAESARGALFRRGHFCTRLGATARSA